MQNLHQLLVVNLPLHKYGQMLIRCRNVKKMSTILILLLSLRLGGEVTALLDQPERSHNHQGANNAESKNTTEIEALLDYDAGLIFYNDNSISACLVERIPQNVLESFENSSAPVFTFPLPSDKLCVGRENEFNTDPELITDAGLLFCNGLPIIDINKVKKFDSNKPRGLNRRKRQTNSYRTAGHYGGAQAQSNSNQPGQASQAQVQGQVFGSGFFSGQAQSQNGGLSQSQVQLAGVGIRGQIASSSGNAQSQLALGAGTGSGQAAGLGEGPSNSQVQVSLGQQGEESMASASASSGGATAGVSGPYNTRHWRDIQTPAAGGPGAYSDPAGGLPPGFVPGTRLFGESVSPGVTSGASPNGGGTGQYYSPQGGGRNGFSGHGQTFPGGTAQHRNGAHQGGGYHQFSNGAGVRNGGSGNIGHGLLHSETGALNGGYGDGGVGSGGAGGGIPQTTYHGTNGYRSQQPSRAGLSDSDSTNFGNGNRYANGAQYPGQQAGFHAGNQISGGGGQQFNPTYGSPGAGAGLGENGQSPSMQPGRTAGGNGYQFTPTNGIGSGYTRNGGISGGHGRIAGGGGNGVGQGAGSGGVSGVGTSQTGTHTGHYTNGARPYAQSITPGAQATTYGLGQAQAQTVYFGSNGAGQYRPVSYEQSSQPGGSPYQNQYVRTDSAGQRQQWPQGNLGGNGISGSTGQGGSYTRHQNGYRNAGGSPTGNEQHLLGGHRYETHTRHNGNQIGRSDLPISSGSTVPSRLPDASGGSGSAGIPGSSGFPGSVRFPSSAGTPGSTGFPGSAGIPGSVGAPGSTGFPGSAGIPGSVGAPGSTGATGPSGFPPSHQLPGAVGISGSNGFPVSHGYPGASGIPGSSTSPGNAASTGIPGSTGFPITNGYHTSFTPGFNGGSTNYGNGHGATSGITMNGKNYAPHSGDATRGLPGHAGEDGFSASYGTAVPSVDDPDGRKCTIVTFSCTIVVESNGRAKICRPNAVQMDRNGNGNGAQGSRICCC